MAVDQQLRSTQSASSLANRAELGELIALLERATAVLNTDVSYSLEDLKRLNDSLGREFRIQESTFRELVNTNRKHVAKERNPGR